MRNTESPLEAAAVDVVRHIEVKAYVDNYESLTNRVAALSNAAPIDRVQHDIFFHCRAGRLKLRSSGQYHHLIFYRRKDDYGPTESFYQFASTQNPAALQTSLGSAFGEAGRVKKFRRTFKLGCTTIHLDRVGGLGDFLEIKTVLNPSSGDESSAAPMSVEQGTGLVESIMHTLDIDLFQLVDGAYIDLINERVSCR